ncbi:type II secretion system protein [Pseudoduganella sp.]|uniref:type II secretion system protein n=1 Tax=Pseudoduganella sp. TaxID=1880898 RepID=UPI0035B00594
MQRRQEGFTYVVVMFMVAVLAIASVRALESAKTAEKRDKETQLLWAGMAYRNAIAAYYHQSPTGKRYANKLSDLLYHGDLNNPTRPLRKLYRDPITGAKDWGVVRNDDGGIIGVYSLSTLIPMKRDGFPHELAAFAGAKKYSDWKFVFNPN